MTLDKIYAGDLIAFRVTLADFPPADGWTLRYRLVPRFTVPTQVPLLLTASIDGEDYVVTVAPGTTASWAAGMYGWARWVEKTGARQVLDDLDSIGQLEILPDPAQAVQGADNRTQAQKALDEANAALASFSASNGRVRRYSIAGREMEFSARSDIIAEVNHWQRVVNGEWRRKVIEHTGSDPNRILARF